MQPGPGLERLRTKIEPRLAALRAGQRWRSLRPLQDAAVDLTHNDYLGLRADQTFQERAREAARRWPLGAGASRLLGGEHAIFGELEELFASWKGAESALYFSSGYAANEALMVALKQEGSIFFSDALNHASLIDGMRLGQLASGQKQIFRHNDPGHLEELLQSTAPQGSLRIIITEALFSMDGDLCPLPKLVHLAERYDALLLIDEAHSLGVYGFQGSGWIEENGYSHDPFITINPCGKALGASGAFIAGPRWFRDYLINTARSFIYSTGPSPWVAAALTEAIPYVSQLSERRQRLRALAAELRQTLDRLSFDSGSSQSHIVPLITGTEASALQAEAILFEKGILARAIRPPTVPEAKSRLRLSLHAGLDQAAAAKLLIALKELRDALS